MYPDYFLWQIRCTIIIKFFKIKKVPRIIQKWTWYFFWYSISRNKSEKLSLIFDYSVQLSAFQNFLISWICLILLPLNSCWWFARNIVDDTVDVVHLINDTFWDFLEKIPRKLGKVSCHSINWCDGTNS